MLAYADLQLFRSYNTDAVFCNMATITVQRRGVHPSIDRDTMNVTNSEMESISDVWRQKVKEKVTRLTQYQRECLQILLLRLQ